jgi:hypothetical protein
MVPPALAVLPPVELELEPPELGLLSLLPQAAAPSASTAQQLRASRFLYLTGDSSSFVSSGGRAGGSRTGESLLPLSLLDVKSA